MGIAHPIINITSVELIQKMDTTKYGSLQFLVKWALLSLLLIDLSLVKNYLIKKI